MFKTLCIGTVALAALTGASYAQTPPAASNDRTGTAPSRTGEPSGGAAERPDGSQAQTGAAGNASRTTTGAVTSSNQGIRVADSATLAIRYATVKPADLTTSKLIGINVYNNQNEQLGEIQDLVIDGGRTISAVVVSVGGFLGLGESYVAVDPSTIVLNDRNGTWRAFVDTSKDNLKNAPKFTYRANK